MVNMNILLETGGDWGGGGVMGVTERWLTAEEKGFLKFGAD